MVHNVSNKVSKLKLVSKLSVNLYRSYSKQPIMRLVHFVVNVSQKSMFIADVGSSINDVRLRGRRGFTLL